ncbi:MAG: tetratricopeptide repeat protein, partial [Gemmatimonadota bacterium]|nr:tetratricopeptide repeat protein [Gemmatimonadota bacterium]
MKQYPSGQIPANEASRGHALLNLGRYDEAERVFECYKDRYPDKPQGYLGYARTAFKRGDQETALERWDALLERFPDHEDGLSGKGHALLNLGRYDEAERVFECYKDRYPD